MSRLSVIKAVWFEGRARSMERLEKPDLLGNMCMIDDFLIIFHIVDSYKGDI